MKGRLLLVAAAFLLAISARQPAFAQYSFPSPEAIAMGEKMKKAFPEDKVYALSENISYHFSKAMSAKRNGTPVVEVKMQTEKELMGLKDNYRSKEYEFYDSFSELFMGRVYRKKGKSYIPMKVEVFDHAYTQNGIFHDDNRLKEFTLDFGTLGDVYKYTITKHILDVRYFPSVHFYEHYPIAEKTVTFHVPDWLEVELKEMNFAGFTVQKSKTRDEKNKVTVYEYRLRNMGAIKKDENAPSMSFTWPHVLVMPKSFEMAGKKENIFGSIDDLYGWFSYLANQVEDNQAALKPLVEELTKDKTTDLAKMEAIYYWVQDNIKYIAFEDGLAGYQPAAAYKVYKDRYGDCKGMANLLKNMLLLAGFDARLTWIGTNRMIPYDFSVHNLAVANHAICTVLLKDKYYYLDGTESYVSLGENADRIQGRQVLIENKDKYLLQNVPVHNVSRNKVERKLTLSVAEGNLVGKAALEYNGEAKTNLLREYHGLKSEEKEEFMKRFADRGNKSLKVANISSSDLANRNIPLKVTYDLTLENALISLDQEMYVNLELDKALESYSMDSTRQSDFFFPEKIMRVSEVEFKVPVGYNVKYLPAPLEISNPDFSAVVSYKQEGDKIKYRKTITVPEGVIKKDKLAEWNSFITQLKKTYNDQVILVKK